MAETRMTLQGKIETEQVTKRASGVEFQRRFTDGKVSPFDKVEWERRAAIMAMIKARRYSARTT